MRDDVLEKVKDLYVGSKRWQEREGIQFDITFEEYLAKWSQYRLDVLGTKIDNGQIERYLKHPFNRPVLGWTSKEERDGGVMHPGNCSIQKTSDQRKMFQFTKGDKHSPETIEKMKKPKTAKTRKNMSEGAKKRWAKYREEKEQK